MSVLAFDLGASGGRALLGKVEHDRLIVEEIYRFSNDPVQVGERKYWDILRLFHELKLGILQARLKGHHDISSIGIDSWAVDFGLIGPHGELLGNPYHYRDDHTIGMMEEVLSLVDRESIFSHTGIQFLPFNTIYQLYALSQAKSPLLDQAQTLLMIPDLLRYFLTGQRKSEFTNATTTQLFNPLKMDWDDDLIQKLSLPRSIFQDVIQPGIVVGTLLPALSRELGVPEIPVMTSAEHDTASAVAAVPADRQNFAYLSCGTWSLLGTEVVQPILSEQALTWNFTNEGGLNGSFRLLKNIMGLWILQECKRVWSNNGENYSYDQLVQLAEQAKPFQSMIDPDDELFLHPQNMVAQIQTYCRSKGQDAPQSVGEIVRCILESLAMKYRLVLERTEFLSDQSFDGLHMVGGGIQNQLLCQMTANALGRPVWTGPEEASGMGNIVVQLIASGQLTDIWQARALIRRSIDMQTFEPQHQLDWDEAYHTFYDMISF